MILQYQLGYWGHFSSSFSCFSRSLCFRGSVNPSLSKHTSYLQAKLLAEIADLRKTTRFVLAYLVSRKYFLDRSLERLAQIF